MNEISLEELAKIIKESKKNHETKREIHREKIRLGTIDEELDKIDKRREKRI